MIDTSLRKSEVRIRKPGRKDCISMEYPAHNLDTEPKFTTEHCVYVT